MPKGLFFPQVLLSDPRFFDLDQSAQYFIVRLFFAADAWGRLPGSPRALAQLTWHDVDFVTDQLKPLTTGPRPFALEYTSGGAPYLQLNQYDCSMEASFLSKRPKPRHPHPPRDVFQRAGGIEISRSDNERPYIEDTSSPQDASPAQRDGAGQTTSALTEQNPTEPHTTPLVGSENEPKGSDENVQEQTETRPKPGSPGHRRLRCLE